MKTALSPRLNLMRRFPILYGLAWALLWSMVGILIIALWAHLTVMTPTKVVIGAYGVHCLSAILGGFVASRAANERGWFQGGMVGLLYALIMLLLSLVVYNAFPTDASGLFRVLLLTLMGAFAGVLGVNTRKET
ncbi:TIGR04086 family membrane protein [Alicyclobacillaceae bacterium I2511]|nr:TIGR04086 family membrane protein [Alicyclobacillaceae bacterium I2511]